MGEYLTVGGTHLKVGTCESAYWVRRDEAEAWDRGEAGRVEHEPHCATLGQWLGANAFWRFPFPWEDGQARNVSAGANRNPFPEKPVISLGAAAGRHREGCCYPRAYRNGSNPLPGSGLLVRVESDHWQPGTSHNWTTVACFWCRTPFAIGSLAGRALRNARVPGPLGEVIRRIQPAPPEYPMEACGTA
ncbi:MAG: hypothetical protein GY937_10100 [bacterium]|nr:hypothetical protein [bacterium]